MKFYSKKKKERFISKSLSITKKKKKEKIFEHVFGKSSAKPETGHSDLGALGGSHLEAQ